MNEVVPLRTGNRIKAIIPDTVEEVFRIAKAVAASGLAPNGMKTPEQITIAIMHGAEIGLPPMQAIQRIAVVNGRPTIWGDAIPALLWSNGFNLVESIEANVATCTVRRPDGTTITRTFSEADARKASLWSKTGPWQQYPQRMLQMRARGLAARDGAADVLSGLYLQEEVDDTPAVDITPKTAALELPDIPDEPMAPAGAGVDQLSVLREIERALTHMTADGVHDQFKAAILIMDEDGRATALEMIEAARTP